MSKERNIKDEDLAKISGGGEELAQNTEIGGGTDSKGSINPNPGQPGGPGQTPDAEGQNPDSPLPSDLSM